MANLTNYTDYDALGLAELVRKREITPRELKEDALSAIEALNPELNCVVGDLSGQAERALDEGLPEGGPEDLREGFPQDDGVDLGLISGDWGRRARRPCK